MAEVIQGASSASFIKEEIPGIEDSKDTLKYITAQVAVGNRNGLDMIQHGKTPVSEGHLIEAGSKRRLIKSVNHGAKKGWIMQPSTGLSLGEEISIIKIVDADTFVIASEFPLALGDEFTIYKHITANYNADGDLNVSVTNSGPVEFVLDGVNQIVTEDTVDPANDRPLPVKVMNLSPVEDAIDESNVLLEAIRDLTETIRDNQSLETLHILKESTRVPVKKSATAADTVPVPVEIVSGSGTEINITSGDINIQTTDMGANFDSMRIGDGSGNYVGVTADTEALVSDLKNGIKLDAIESAVNTLATSGLATEAKQDDNLNALDSIIMELNEIAQDVMQMNLNVATEATLALVQSAVDSISAQLPATLGAKISDESLSVVLASDQSPIPVEITSSETSTGGSQSKGTVGSGLNGTVIPPSNAIGFIIKNSATSEGFLCWEIGGIADINSFDLMPATSTAFIACNSVISLYAREASASYSIQWFTK